MTHVSLRGLRATISVVLFLAGTLILAVAIYPGWLGLGIGGFGRRQAAGAAVGLALLIVGTLTSRSQQPGFRPPQVAAQGTRVWSWALNAVLIGLIIVLIARAFHALVVPLWNQTLDDAYITLRFSRNLIAGFGLRWNPTDALPIEGYTSLTHVLLGAVFMSAGWEPVVATKVASLLALGGIAGLFGLQALRVRAWPVGFLVAVLLLAGNPYVYFAAINGMDTSFAALAVTLCAVTFFLAKDQPHFLPLFCLATLIGLLTRPDAVLFLAGLWGWLAWRQRRSRHFWTWVVAGLLVPGIVYASLKLWYFGDLLPTSFYFKARLGELTLQVPLVTAFLIWFVLPGGLLLMALTLADRSHVDHLLILLAGAAAMAYFVSVRPAVATGYRFLVPFYPAIVIALIRPAGSLGQWLTSPDQPAFRRAVALGTLIGLGLTSIPNPAQFNQDSQSLRLPSAGTDTAIGLALTGLPNPQAIVLATGEAGAIPYFSDFFHVDPYGLVTKDRRSNPFSPDMIFERQPDVFITHSISATAEPDGLVVIDPAAITWYLKNPDVSTPKFSYLIISDPRFAAFALVAKIPNHGEPANLAYHYIFVRRDSPYAAEITSRFSQLQVSIGP